MYPAKRLISFFLAVVVLFSFTCCSRQDSEKISSSSGIQNEGYLEIVKALEHISLPDINSNENKALADFVKKYKKANAEKKTEILLELADDMAIAKYYGLITQEMISIGAFAVKEYPHPILLNNFAAMLNDYGSSQEAAVFFEQAALQEADNPIIFTNLASIMLESENYEKAEIYAKKALAIEPEFGPAYQILTTIHLKNNNSILAAETMVKSAKHCFDSTTIYHFDSFLYAVEGLNPAEDEYPLKEEFLKELHVIARDNVDTLDNDKGTDTPGKQLTLKPFPELTGAENLMKSQEWLTEQFRKTDEARSASQQRRSQYSSAEEKRFEYGSPSEGKYPVFKNIRQIYAIKVLQSFYDFKIRKYTDLFYKDIEKIKEKENEELEDLGKTYEEYYNNANKELDKEMSKTWAGLIQALDGGDLPDVEKLQQAGLLAPKLGVMQQKERINIYKRYTNDIINLSQTLYQNTSQALEEYWLKTGGLLKYIIDEDQFEFSCADREVFVYDNICRPLSELETRAGLLNGEEDSLKMAEHMLKILEESVAGHRKAAEQAQKEENSEKEKENKSDEEDMIPDIEKEAISNYKEKDDIGTIGADVSLFELIGASTSYNGDEVSVETNCIGGSVSGTQNLNTGESTAVVLYGVSATGSTEWIHSEKAAKLLENTGALGKGANVIGKIGFSFSSGTRKGEYVVMDANKKIIDRGMVHVRESGGEIGPIGRSKKVEVRKSYLTGIATKTTSTKYKFIFATYEK